MFKGALDSGTETVKLLYVGANVGANQLFVTDNNVVAIQHNSNVYVFPKDISSYVRKDSAAYGYMYAVDGGYLTSYNSKFYKWDQNLDAVENWAWSNGGTSPQLFAMGSTALLVAQEKIQVHDLKTKGMTESTITQGANSANAGSGKMAILKASDGSHKIAGRRYQSGQTGVYLTDLETIQGEVTPSILQVLELF